MNRLILAVALVLFAAPAFADDDPRVSPREIGALGDMVGKVTESAARLAAMLDIEKVDHAADQKKLKDLQDWVKAYFGE